MNTENKEKSSQDTDCFGSREEMIDRYLALKRELGDVVFVKNELSKTIDVQREEIERQATVISNTPGWVALSKRWPLDSDYEPTGRIVAMNLAGYATCVTGLTLNTICGNRCDGWDETPEESNVPITDVVRWMPIPEPLK